ncbi:MAG: hypothetical protein OIN66_01030 [Candidatus Methanoperedens sp.]|nr:hypothetical protein [Candidatus Methanoperedens sp.]
MSAFKKLKVWLGWCPNASIAEQKTRFIDYRTASVNIGAPVKKWKFELLILGHICTLLFASLFILPNGAGRAYDLYNSPYLGLNHGVFLADVTMAIASILFSAAAIMVIYNVIIFKKLYHKLCFFNLILLSGLFAAIILEASLLGDYNLEWSIYWAFLVAVPLSIPSFLSIRLDKGNGGQGIVEEGIGLVEIIKRSMGWCPNTAAINKKEEICMVPYEGKYVDKIKGMGFSEFLCILHLVFAVWLMITALWVLAKPPIFPWWITDINIISSGLLLAVGITSVMIFFNFIKITNVHRILALVNIILLIAFYLYLSQFLVSSEYNNLILNRLYNNYSFGFVTLILFTLIISVPSLLTFLNKPTGEKKTGFLISNLLILIVVLAALSAYYLYLDKQKDKLLVDKLGKNGEYKLYSFEQGASWGYPYFLDAPGDTTGHQISKGTYEAMQFLLNKETGKVISWWDFGLDIKAAGKEPVISYASNDIKLTIARPASLYDKYEPNEKVADVSRFFTTNSEDTARDIAEKYGADIVYISRQRMSNLFPVMLMAADPGFSFQNNPDVQSPGALEKKYYEPSIAYRFNNGAELKYFEKIFENKDVYIYQLKK